MNADDGLVPYLEEIAKRSAEGTISWSQPNPSTFQWVEARGTDNFTVTIQKAVSPINKLIDLANNVVYLFQVTDGKKTVVSISSKDRPEFVRQLALIYLGAEQAMDLRASQVLRRLLGH